ncbi:MAG TPA: GTPase, partial [Candidatus Brocadiales bacterium]|nr:GTPase [Candidatus Brocadiales bacterium]
RDVLEGVLELGNIHFRLLDTAGFMKTEKELESLAIAKAHNTLQMGQLILFVIDGSKEVGCEDIELFNSLPSSQRIIVVNKCDIATNTPLYPLLIEGTKAGIASLPSKKRGTGGVSPLSDDFQRYPIVRTSAITAEGLNDLKNAMIRTILEGRIDQSASDVTLNARHKAAFKRTLELIECAKEAAARAQSYEFIVLDLRDALETLGEVAGETTTEDILDKIFSNFCIGK